MAQGFASRSPLGRLWVASLLSRLLGDIDCAGIEAWTVPDPDPRSVHIGAGMALLHDGDADGCRRLLERLAERPELSWLDWVEDLQPVSAYRDPSGLDYDVVLGIAWSNGDRASVIFGARDRRLPTGTSGGLAPCTYLDEDFADHAPRVNRDPGLAFEPVPLAVGVQALEQHLQRLDDLERDGGDPALHHEAALLRWLSRRIDAAEDRGLSWGDDPPPSVDLAA